MADRWIQPLLSELSATEERRPVSARHLANLLTALRIFLSIPIVLLVLGGSDYSRSAAVLLFAAAGLTDLLDGYVARRWGTVSTLGRFLDPLADKCVVDGCLLALVLRSRFPLPIAGVLLARDLTVTLMRVRRGVGNGDLAPSQMAKAKTFCLYAGVGGLLLSSGGRDAIGWWAWILITLAIVFSLLSLADYLKRLRWSVRLPRFSLRYLLLPRPGPLLSAGKISFFLLGSFVAFIAGFPLDSLRRWLVVFFVYEFVVSQGKYLFNDICGRHSDVHFLRGSMNQCPRSGPGLVFLLGYATARAAVGIVALLAFAGWTAAFAGLLTVSLQLLYELVKYLRLPGRGGGLFGLASANYGVRALAGMTAVSGPSLVSGAGVLVFLWAATLGSLFLAIYWRRQGAYYLGRQQLSPVLLARHKPGVLALYGRGLLVTRRGGLHLDHALLAMLAVIALSFRLLTPWRGIPSFVVSMAAYLGVGLAGLVALRWRRCSSGWWLALSEAAMVLAIAAAAAGGLRLRNGSFLPAMLLAIAVATYLVVSSPEAEALVLDGSAGYDPAPA